MIARILDELTAAEHFRVVHLPFRFTKDIRQTRRGGVGKVAELFLVLLRLMRIRVSGRIDSLLYPVGGPQLVPLIRDICLLPWMLLAGRNVLLHFHAGGIAETIDKQPAIVRTLIRRLYRKSTLAIVMTEFGKRDALSVGIKNIEVVPHSLEDQYDAEILNRGTCGSPRLLYVGHFSEDKGTPALLEAAARLRDSGRDCRLILVGEPVPPYTESDLQSLIETRGLQSVVEVCGVLSGKAKWAEFGKADLFVFPSLAAESFGLAMAEGMMWALPIVACDWRGNREVLGNPFGGIVFDPRPDLSSSLTEALRKIMAADAQWVEWGRINRQTFLTKYAAGGMPSRLVQLLEQVINGSSGEKNAV